MDLREQLQQSLGTTYLLERELGGGGMSRVFVANEQRLNRKVVIKLLSPEMSAGVDVERFEREIQLAASLQQANIVPIISAGDTNGLPYYTMPFVEGKSLRARLTGEGALPINTVVGVMRDVARALAYSHERGVVHRDIKPDNVLLSGGTAVVTDFGIAKAISAARAEPGGGSLTQLGTSLGTPAYMSPEQAAGDPQVDHRADIYSLGCMAYELLTGKPPFHDRPPARILAAHITERPVPLATLRPDAPPALDDLVMRCLDKDPSRRPQSGDEIVQTLDTILSGSTASLSGLRLEAPGSLPRAIGFYAAVALVVAVVARAAVIALGVPEWVFPGALIVMGLGLPVVLFAWYADQTVRKVATTTPRAGATRIAPVTHGTMTTLALKAAPRLTWRRAWMGGAIALGSFVALVIGFMVLRALGIGPAGSLLAAGRLEDRGRLIVTSFPSPDSSLSLLVTEAVRTNLSQSRVVSVMPPVAIAAALDRMQRPRDSELTFDLAREIALREGVKAIVDGSIRSLAGGYVLSLRLVSADSARELALFQETANGPDEILKAIDQLTRDLRGKIGESLRDVRASPALDQVTTSSLEALRIYAEAARSIDMGGNPIAGAERLREAVRLDTTFAMAWRKLGVALSNANLPRAQVDSALAKAYQYRDRLTELERLLAEGTYFQLGPGRDRGRAIRAYEALLALDPTETAPANNLASIYVGRREYAHAESLYKEMIAGGRATSQQYTNLIPILFNQGKFDEAEQLIATFAQRFPSATFPQTAPLSFLYQRNQLDSMERQLKALAASSNPILRINGVGGLANYSLMRGRIADLERYAAQARQLQQALGQPPNALIDSLQVSQLDMGFYDDTARAVRRMDATVARTDFRAMLPDQRPYLALAGFYANAGQVVRAKSMVDRWDAEMTDTSMHRILQAGRRGILGAIALAEGRYDEALRDIWAADTTYDGPNGNCGMCIYDDIGYAYSRAGKPDSAIVWFEKYLATPYFARQSFDGAAKPLILKRLGELYESTGDPEKAALRYREFLALWDKADPKLQPKVADVRYRLSRLANIERDD
jgi:tetratricopeptide (TPR) repeat protein/tRNA A-37 threonylcarbamoyl transferase component Bud32